jgi:hypothetical protein
VECDRFPVIKTLPLPLQKLTVQELRLAQAYVNDVVPVRPFTDKLSCQCNLYRQYLMPCCHIWQRHLTYNSISNEEFKQLFAKFEDAGFEVYETEGRVEVEVILVKEDTTPQVTQDSLKQAPE